MIPSKWSGSWPCARGKRIGGPLLPLVVLHSAGWDPFSACSCAGDDRFTPHPQLPPAWFPGTLPWR